jgi:hypothetical protein
MILNDEFFQKLYFILRIDHVYQFGRYLQYGDIRANVLKQLEVAPCFHYSLSMYNNFYATLYIKDSIGRHRKLLHGEE